MTALEFFHVSANNFSLPPGVYIQRTVVTLETSEFIRERQSDEEVTFDLEVMTDVLSSTTSGQFLLFRTFISDDPAGTVSFVIRFDLNT